MSPRDELLAALRRAGYSANQARDLAEADRGADCAEYREALSQEKDALRQQLEAEAAVQGMLRDERDHLAEQIGRVRDLHQPTEYGNCTNRCYTSGIAPRQWPCPTIHALDGAS